MKSLGARVSAKTKYVFQGCQGPLALAQTPARHRKKNQEGDPWGFVPLHPPVRICAAPRHLCVWEIWAVTTAPGQIWTGWLALLLSWLCYTPSRGILLLLGRHLTRPLNLVDLGGLRLQDPFANLLYG